MNKLSYKDFIARIKFQKSIVDIKRELYYNNTKITEKSILKKLYKLNREAGINIGYKHKTYEKVYQNYIEYKKAINKVLSSNN